MAIDAQRFMDVCNYIHMLWSAPVQIALSLYFLYQEMGSAIFAGFGVMLLLIPVNTWIAGKERAISRKLMKKKDSRIKQMKCCVHVQIRSSRIVAPSVCPTFCFDMPRTRVGVSFRAMSATCQGPEALKDRPAPNTTY